jgi:hypothetical protein
MQSTRWRPFASRSISFEPVLESFANSSAVAIPAVIAMLALSRAEGV